jgi:hypothetical protein
MVAEKFLAAGRGDRDRRAFLAADRRIRDLEALQPLTVEL